MTTPMSPFAKSIYLAKYAARDEAGELIETDWSETARRVVPTVLAALGYGPESDEVRDLTRLVEDRKFIPGGRYLYATGKDYHQTNNCLLLRADDSREGWADLFHKAAMSLQTGAGIGVDYSAVRAKGSRIRRTGGIASGPIELMKAVNELGRSVMQGGNRRSAIWAGLKWSHPDVFDFIHLKDWPDYIKAAKERDFNAPAAMDMTNISVLLDDEFFAAYHDHTHAKHQWAAMVMKGVVAQMFRTGEPGFSVNLGEQANDTLRNAPVAADTRVLTAGGYERVGDIVGEQVSVWTGKRWASTTFKKTAEMIPTVRVAMSGGRFLTCDPTHEFILDDGRRVAAQDLKVEDSLLVSLPTDEDFTDEHTVAYMLGFIYGDGSFTGADRADLTLCTEEKKACRDWFSQILPHTVTEVDSRGYTRLYFKGNSLLRDRTKMRLDYDIMGESKAFKWSFIAGLFDADGSYDAKQHRIRLSSKHRPFLADVQRILEELGILSSINVGAKSGFTGGETWMLVVNGEYVTRFAAQVPTKRVRAEPHQAYRKTKIKVLGVEDAEIQDVFCCDVGVEEHSFMAEGVIISNCTEVTSADDSDVCNLGSINLARVTSLEEMRRVTQLGTLFLLAGTKYSDVPYSKVAETRAKNRRLGLGLMGLHEFLAVRGLKYEPSKWLGEYLVEYANSGEYAKKYAIQHGLSVPVATRAIAPTGTIAIVAETTTGIEPIFCVAYKRRYLDAGKVWKFQYVIDPTARKLVEQGVDPDAIEDAYMLSLDMERRVRFQAWLQTFVDMSISSTINMPAWGTAANDESLLAEYERILIQYLPKIRGITVYPDGARGGQPLSPVPYKVAAGNEGVVFEESDERCLGGVCGA
jgi:hypothetical protein